MIADYIVDSVWGDENSTPINHPDKKRPCAPKLVEKAMQA